MNRSIVAVGIVLMLAGCASEQGNMAKRYEEQNDWYKAVITYRAAHDAHPDDVEITSELARAEFNAAEYYYKRGMSSLADNDYDAAITEFEQGLIAQPDNAKLLAAVKQAAMAKEISQREKEADRYIQLGDMERAQQALQRAMELAPGLPGQFQLPNSLNAVAAARYLQNRGYRISNDAIVQGIAGAIWPGRLEKVQTQPDVYLDGAHNPSAARELAAFWERTLASRKLWLVFGALRDKAVDEIAGVLFPHAAEVIFTQPRTTRAISVTQLAEITSHHAAHFTIVPEPEAALEYALERAAPHDIVFVAGSLYLVGQLRHYWKNRAPVATR